MSHWRKSVAIHIKKETKYALSLCSLYGQLKQLLCKSCTFAICDCSLFLIDFTCCYTDSHKKNYTTNKKKMD